MTIRIRATAPSTNVTRLRRSAAASCVQISFKAFRLAWPSFADHDVVVHRERACHVDDDVAVHRDAERARHLDDRARHLDVGARRPRIAGGVVVHEAAAQVLLPWRRDRLHSIISSARIRNESGMRRPSALAVARLMVRSNLVGCSTGMSAGFVPRRILSTYSAARRNAPGMLGP
jgi:hypothetical protein